MALEDYAEVSRTGDLVLSLFLCSSLSQPPFLLRCNSLSGPVILYGVDVLFLDLSVCALVVC